MSQCADTAAAAVCNNDPKLLWITVQTIVLKHMQSMRETVPLKLLHGPRRPGLLPAPLSVDRKRRRERSVGKMTHSSNKRVFPFRLKHECWHIFTQSCVCTWPYSNPSPVPSLSGGSRSSHCARCERTSERARSVVAVILGPPPDRGHKGAA